MPPLSRSPNFVLLATIVATQVQATEVALRNHVAGGLVATLEDAKSKSVLEVFQNRTVISGAVETGNQNGNVKQPEIVRHWGFSHEHPFWGSPMLTAFLHYLSFAVVIKSMCMMSNVLFQVSPLPQVRHFQEKQTTGETDAAPFVAIAFGGSQWCFYGIFAYLVTGKSGFLVLVYSNFLGALLGVYYVLTFHTNCTRLTQISGLSMYYRVVSAVVLIQIGAIAAMPRERALFISGLISSTCSIAQSLSGLVTLPHVIKTKCAASIPLPLCVACGISNGLWITCGLMLWDPWIICPNVVGLTLSLVSVGLYFYYGCEEKKLDLKDDQDPVPTGSLDDSSTACPREYSDLLSQHGGCYSASSGSVSHNFCHIRDQELGVQNENYGSCADAGTGGT